MKASRPMKSKTSSFRLNKELDKPVNEWLSRNPTFTLSQLINSAIQKFIFQKQVLEPVKTVKASDEKVAKAAKRMMKKHADMLEKLK